MLLALIAIAVIYDRFSWDTPKFAQEMNLVGTWVGTQGNSLQLKEDGTAIGRRKGSVDKSVFRWRIEDGIFTLELLSTIEGRPVNRGATWFVANSINDLLNFVLRDDYYRFDHQWTMRNNDSLLLTEVPSNRVEEFKRAKPVK